MLRPTDKAGYRVACTRLKNLALTAGFIIGKVYCIFRYWEIYHRHLCLFVWFPLFFIFLLHSFFSFYARRQPLFISYTMLTGFREKGDALLRIPILYIQTFILKVKLIGGPDPLTGLETLQLSSLSLSDWPLTLWLAYPTLWLALQTPIALEETFWLSSKPFGWPLSPPGCAPDSYPGP